MAGAIKLCKDCKWNSGPDYRCQHPEVISLVDGIGYRLCRDLRYPSSKWFEFAFCGRDGDQWEAK